MMMNRMNGVTTGADNVEQNEMGVMAGADDVEQNEMGATSGVE